MVGVLLGCATPTPNPWETVKVPSEPIEAPLPCAELPRPQDWGKQGQGRYDALMACAEANRDIATEHGTGIQQMRVAAENLTEAGQHQRAIADMREEMLAEERRHNFFTNIGQWVLIVVLGVAAL